MAIVGRTEQRPHGPSGGHPGPRGPRRRAGAGRGAAGGAGRRRRRRGSGRGPRAGVPQGAARSSDARPADRNCTRPRAPRIGAAGRDLGVSDLKAATLEAPLGNAGGGSERRDPGAYRWVRSASRVGGQRRRPGINCVAAEAGFPISRKRVRRLLVAAGPRRHCRSSIASSNAFASGKPRRRRPPAASGHGPGEPRTSPWQSAPAGSASTTCEKRSKPHQRPCRSNFWPRFPIAATRRAWKRLPPRTGAPRTRGGASISLTRSRPSWHAKA